MVTRITSQAQQANSLQNIFRITENLFKAQQEIATGKRINRPSDDPAGMRDALLLRTEVNQANQFIRNIDNNRIFIQVGDTSLASVNVNLIRAKELAVSQTAGIANPQTRISTSAEINEIIAKVIETANTKVKGQHIFSGTNFRVPPFSSETSGAIYLGNTESFKVRVADGVNVDFSIPGSQVLATDLNPKLKTSTTLSSLNGGIGITAGSFSIFLSALRYNN